jgi:hypothetical protein
MAPTPTKKPTDGRRGFRLAAESTR